MVKEIFKYPNPCLSKPSIAIDFNNEDVKDLVQNLIDTMYNSNGVGIAACQIGENKQIFIIDHNDQPMVFINPKILNKNGEQCSREGCLSFPNIFLEIMRPQVLEIQAYNKNSLEFKFVAENFLAVAISHEFDHLQGKTFLDYLSPLKRKILEQKLK